MRKQNPHYMLLAMAVAAACVAGALVRAIATPVSAGSAAGLAIEIDNGLAVPLQVKRGQTFYLNQIDLRASATSAVDEGVAGLSRSGDFAALRWSGVEREEQEFVLLPNPDGTFTRRSFFRGAEWMNTASTFRMTQIDAQGEAIGQAMIVQSGVDNQSRNADGSSFGGSGQYSGREIVPPLTIARVPRALKRKRSWNCAARCILNGRSRFIRGRRHSPCIGRLVRVRHTGFQ